MKRPRRSIAWVAFSGSLALTAAGTSRAALTPSHAQADVEAARAQKGYSFCSAPRDPLPSRARNLCAHASEIPNCAGLVAACAHLAAAPPKAEADPARPTPPEEPTSLHIPGLLGSIASAIVWLIAIALVLAILVPVVQAILRARRDRALSDPPSDEAIAGPAAPAPAVVAVEMTDDDLLLARAEQHARRGEFTLALQLYLAASLRALDKRGAVRLARDRTNGEYVRSCADANAKPSLREIVREVDRVQFGREEPTADAVARAAQRATSIVRALPAALLVMAVVLMTGCRGHEAARSSPGDNPAGSELLYDLMQRQGVDIKPLETAMASLPLPKKDERPAAILVDLGRVDLDEETRDHLVEWVDAGGTLVLAGRVTEWPRAFGARVAVSSSHGLGAKRLLGRAKDGADEGEASETAEDGDAGAAAMRPDEPIYAEAIEHGEVVDGWGLQLADGAERVAWLDDQTLYAGVVRHGKGHVLGLASDELLTNVGLARPDNAAAFVAILSNADRLELRVAQVDDGVSPPSSPLSALVRAKLGPGLAHALAATLVLFLAAGVRLTRPRPVTPPARRAFAEHVEAVGALYARAGSAPHALAAYARFADERVRARMPRGASDVPAFLAAQSHLPLDLCQRVWARADAAKADLAPRGDELAALKELSVVYTAAMGRDR